MARKNRTWLKIFVFVIIFMLLFSVIGIVVVYLRWINLQQSTQTQIVDSQAVEDQVISIIPSVEQDEEVAADTEVEVNVE